MKIFFKKLASAVLMMCLAASMVFIASSKAEASGKLITHYKFNGDFKDATGNGNDGTKVGDVSFADDSTVGKCAVFNGGYINVPSSPGLNLGSKFTISVWVMVDPSMAANGNKEGSIISKLDDRGSYNIYHAYTRGTFGVRMDSRFTSGEKSIQTGPFQDWGLSGSWSHLVFSCDGQTLYMYHNGDLKSTKEISGSIKPSGNKMRIGTGNDMNTSNLFFKGRMADLRIYNYSLSSDEIKAMYDGGADTTQSQPATTTGTTTPGTSTAGTTLVAQYKFNGDFKDASGNGNDGTKVGDVSFANDSTVGKCAVFNGGYINVPSSPGLNLGSKFTISVWVMVDPSMAANGNKEGSIISKLDDRGSYNIYHAYTRGTYGAHMYALFTSGEKQVVPGPFQDWGLSGDWSHLVFSCDGQTLYMYHNGDLKSTKEISGSIKPSGNKMRIGTGNDMNTSNLFFKGRMADLRIYNYAMNSDEIKAMYVGGADTTQSQPATTTGTTTPGTSTTGTTAPGTVNTGTPTPGAGSGPVTIINNTTNVITNTTNTTNNANTNTNITGSTISNSNIASNNKTTQTTSVENAVTVSEYVNVAVNGQPLQSDVKPFVNTAGRTMLPVRAIAEALGAQVQWDDATQTATLTLGAKTVKVTIGQNSILVNGQPVAMDTAAAIKDGRTLLPVRSVGEALGARVGWDAQTKTVQLNR